jgi:hypothetical protein
VLQQRWADTYGPEATGEYAGKSYWLATENWPDQNYPVDLSVYYESGGFSNGYVPLFIIVGFQNKVYWDGNSSSFESALQQAINDMPTEGVFVKNPFADRSLLFETENYYDVSEVFWNLNGDPVSVSVESNSNPSIATVSITDNIMTIYANGYVEGITEITLAGTSGEFTNTDSFFVKVYNPENYSIEDFETGNFSNMPWYFAGSADWSTDEEYIYEGLYSAKSGTITHSQRSELLVEADFSIGGRISFFSKVSSELNYDFLKFYIGRYEMMKISGQTAWKEYEFEVDPGVHIFKWSFQKDGSTTSYSDCAWIDYITFEGGRVSGIENRTVPLNIELHQNYPNPFNPETTISFGIPEDGPVKLSVFNYKGELVKNIFEGSLSKGMHSYNFNGSDLTSGVYFYRLVSGGNYAMKKMIIIK